MDERNELLFWVEIMKEHAEFQIITLAPMEEVFIKHSTYYRDFFQRMMEEIERSGDYKSLIPNLTQGLLSFIEYKKVLLKGVLTCQIKINLTPKLINDQISEAMEFHVFLTTSRQDRLNIKNIVGYIKSWLSDSVGHAAGIAAFLDPSEELLQEEALRCKTNFGKLQLKASGLEMMHERTDLKDGPLRLLANETIRCMNNFINYLEKIRMLRINCEALGNGTFSPEIAEHFISENRYYIAKIEDFMR